MMRRPTGRPPPDPNFVNALVVCMLGVALGFGLYWLLR
jgi:hypothetical protein